MGTSASRALEMANSLAEKREEQPSRGNATDELLVSQALKGNESAYEALIQRYQNRIFHYVRKMVKNRRDAEDLTQEVFVKAHFSLDKLNNPAVFKSWLFRIAHNKALDFLRKRRPKVVDTEDNLRETYVDPKTPEEDMLREEQRRQVNWALDQLDEKHREVLVLCDLQGMSYQEIADTLEIPFGTVQSRIFYARKKIAELLDPKNLFSADGEVTK